MSGEPRSIAREARPGWILFHLGLLCLWVTLSPLGFDVRDALGRLDRVEGLVVATRVVDQLHGRGGAIAVREQRFVFVDREGREHRLVTVALGRIVRPGERVVVESYRSRPERARIEGTALVTTQPFTALRYAANAGTLLLLYGGWGFFATLGPRSTTSARSLSIVALALQLVAAFFVLAY